MAQYIIYDDSKDPTDSNSLVIYNDRCEYYCKHELKVSTLVGNLVGIRLFGNVLYVSQESRCIIFDKVTNLCLWCNLKPTSVIVYNRGLYDWIEWSNSKKCAIINLGNIRDQIHRIFEDDYKCSPVVALMRHYGYRMDLSKVDFGHDLFKKYNARGFVNVFSGFEDVTVVVVINNNAAGAH